MWKQRALEATSSSLPLCCFQCFYWEIIVRLASHFPTLECNFLCDVTTLQLAVELRKLGCNWRPSLINSERLSRNKPSRSEAVRSLTFCDSLKWTCPAQLWAVRLIDLSRNVLKFSLNCCTAFVRLTEWQFNLEFISLDRALTNGLVVAVLPKTSLHAWRPNWVARWKFWLERKKGFTDRDSICMSLSLWFTMGC